MSRPVAPWLALSLALAACNGAKDPPVVEPCDEPGTICNFLGKPEEARFTEDDTRQKTYLYLPQDISFGPDGTAYYPDFNNHRVRRVTVDGMVETVSGTGFLGDGPNAGGSVVNCWEGCDALLAAWNHPTHVLVDPNNPDELWVSAWHNSRINLIDTATNTVTWYAGTGGRFYLGGERETAILDLPSSIAFGPDGTLYFSDQANHLIRKITASGMVEDVAGLARRPGFAGDGGPAIDAQLHGHTDQKADPGSRLEIAGNKIYIADTLNGVIRAIDLDTMAIERVAGQYTSAGAATYTDAITGEEYEADAGSVPGYSGDGGSALDAVLNLPRDLAIGIDGEIYIADTMNNCVRVVDPDGTIRTFAGKCGPEQAYKGNEVPATEARLNHPFGVGVDPDGNVYIADTENQLIRRVAR